MTTRSLAIPAALAALALTACASDPDDGVPGGDASILDLLDATIPRDGAGTDASAGIDHWYGGAELTFTQPDGSYKVTGTDLVWTSTITGDGRTLYEITSGTVAYEMTDPECTIAFAPSTVSWDPAGTVASQLDYRFAATPITFTGSGSMFWMAQMTVTCPDGSNTIPQLVGGQFFRAAENTQPMGEVLADDYTLMDAYHHVYSFHR